MLSPTKTLRFSFISALLIAVGPAVLGCSADDGGVAPAKKDAGGTSSAGGGSGAAGSSSTTTGASGSTGIAGNVATGAGGTTGAGGAGTGGMSGAGGAAGGEDCTTDSDGDGTPDCKDDCDLDKLKTKEGVCGCGIPDLASGDVTGDGGIDCQGGQYYEAETGTFSSSDAGATTDGGAAGPWAVGNDAQAAGGKYIVSPGGLDDGLPGPAHSSHALKIPADGMYTIFGRFYTPSRDHNRIWFRVDSGIWQKMLSTSGEFWFWFSFHKDNQWDMPIQFQLTTGMHTLEIANDTDGVKIDRFYVTSGSEKPKAMTGDDTTCNPPHTVAVGGVCRESCGMLHGGGCNDTVACAGKPVLAAYDCTICCDLTAGDAAAE